MRSRLEVCVRHLHGSTFTECAVPAGLETLGIFRPHRLAENSNRQNSIIKHYLASIEKEVAPSPTAKASLNDIFGQASSPTEAYQ